MSPALMRYDRYLTAGINRMSELLDQADAFPEKNEYLPEAATIGCKRLQMLAADPEFYHDLSRVHEPSRAWPPFAFPPPANLLPPPPDPWAHWASLRQSEDDFIQFLRLEREVLVKGGVDPQVADGLLALCWGIPAVPYQDPGQVIGALFTLRDQACGLASELRYQRQQELRQLQEEDKRRDHRKALRKVWIGVGGAIMVGLNLGAGAATIGLAAAMAGVSAAIGEGLIVSAATG
jgi:hypothetical protein